jgi:hypothetical protein
MLLRFLLGSALSLAVMAAEAPRPSPELAIHLSPTQTISPSMFKGKLPVLLVFIDTT